MFENDEASAPFTFQVSISSRLLNLTFNPNLCFPNSHPFLLVVVLPSLSFHSLFAHRTDYLNNIQKFKLSVSRNWDFRSPKSSTPITPNSNTNKILSIFWVVKIVTSDACAFSIYCELL